MAYGSTLSDLQSGINNAAQVEANNQAAIRDYYARLADIRARRAMATEDVGQRDRAVLANTGVQARGQDVNQLLGLGQINASTANVLAQIAERDRALEQQGTQFTKGNEFQLARDKALFKNNLAIAKNSLSPKGQEAAQIEKGILDEWNASATAIASQANQQLEAARATHKASSLTPFKFLSPTTWDDPWQSTTDAKLASSIDAIRSGLGPHADKIIWDGKQFQPAIRNGSGSPVTPVPSPKPAPAPVPPPAPAPVPPPAPILDGGATGPGVNPSSWSVTPLPVAAAAPVASLSGLAAMPSMGGSFGGPGGGVAAPAAVVAPMPVNLRRSSVSLPQPVQLLGGAPGSPDAKRAQFQAAWVEWTRNNTAATPEERNIAMTKLKKLINGQPQNTP